MGESFMDVSVQRTKSLSQSWGKERPGGTSMSRGRVWPEGAKGRRQPEVLSYLEGTAAGRGLVGSAERPVPKWQRCAICVVYF